MFKKIVLGVLLVLVIAGVYGYFSFVRSPTVAAQLHVESGVVRVNDVPITGNVRVKAGDWIETLDGRATVILFESVFVSLQEKTKVLVEDLAREHIQVVQEGGKTWNKVTKIAGVGQFTIREGKSIASVRGTAFAFSAGKVVVGEGSVEVTMGGKTFTVSAGKVVEQTPGGEAVERAATPEERAQVVQLVQRSVDELKYARDLEIAKNAVLVDAAKKQYGVTDAEVEAYLASADAGGVSVDDLTAKAPVQTDSVKKIAGLTKEIQQMNQAVAGGDA